MAVTRLKRKAKRNKVKAKVRNATIQRLNTKPTLKNVDIEQIKEEFAKKVQKPAAKKEEVKAEVTEEKAASKAEKKEASPKKKATPKAEKKEEAPKKKAAAKKAD